MGNCMSSKSESTSLQSASLPSMNVIIPSTFQEYIDLYEEEGKNNTDIALFISLLQSGVLDNHLERYVIICDGIMWPETFGSIEDSCALDLGDSSAILFRVPQYKSLN